MLILHVELHYCLVTLLFGSVFCAEGGSGLSQLGGIPALRGVAGIDLLMMFASLILII